MKICYADKSQPATEDLNAIFLAGPTPRSSDVPSWRPEALQILETLGYDGTVFVPERSDWTTKFTYEHQTDWEYSNLLHSRVIAFWVPRNMETMPALTTNVEFGFWLARSPERVVYGRPENAANTRYLDWLYAKWVRLQLWSDVAPSDSLQETMKLAVEVSRFSKD